MGWRNMLWSRMGILLVMAALFLGVHTRLSFAQDLESELDAVDEEGDSFAEDDDSEEEESEEELDEGLDEEDEGLDEEEDLADEESDEETEEDADEFADEESDEEGDDELADEEDSAEDDGQLPVVQKAPSLDRAASGLVQLIEFRQLSDRVRVVVSADKAPQFQKQANPERRQVTVILPDFRIDHPLLKNVIDTGEFDGPVAMVQGFNSSVNGVQSAKILIQLRRNMEPNLLASGSRLFVDFPLSAADGAIFKGSIASTTPELPQTFLSVNETMRFRGKRISINVKEAPVRHVLDLIATASGQNFVLSGGAGDQKVTLNVKDTPWDQILAIILLNSKLGYQKIGETYRVMPVGELTGEINLASEAAKKLTEVQPLDTKLITLNYARAAEVSKNAEDFKSSRGKISVDQRTNTLVVTDVADSIARITQYVQSVDRQTPQVLIEGRVVEAKEDASKRLNIGWSGVIGSGRLAGSRLSNGGAGAGPFNFNVGTLGNFSQISLNLDMLENKGLGKTISSPRVQVLDNVQALISQGTEINIPVTGQNGALQNLTINANLELQVTPQVAPDGYVLLKLNLKKDTPSANQSTQGTSIDTQRAQTELLVESGKTAVIGGIYSVENTKNESRIPFLGDLPLLGKMLFRPTQESTGIKKELLMFISPKVINPERVLVNLMSDSRSARQTKLEVDDEGLSDEDLEDDVEADEEPDADDVEADEEPDAEDEEDL